MIAIKYRQRRTSVLSDAELARAAHNGDAASLGVLLERHRAALYALALRILGRGPEAQDAVQDAFVVALSGIDRLREPQSVGGWLRGVLRNVCLVRLRERRGEVLFEERPHRVEEGTLELSAEEAIDRLALREWVWTALSELPEALRVTAMLRYFGSYGSYEEIAAILGVPVGTVRSRLNRVKAKLADALLETAGLEHGEARRLNESQARLFGAVFGEYNRGEGYETLAGVVADDFLYAEADGTTHGREWFIDMLEDDLETGMKLRITNMIASTDVTIIEGDLDNPPDDPFHCPPATSQVYFYRDGRISLMREYFAPRPPEREGEEAGHKP
jgi:RNA polymerase sigma-70 factor (ECF subfamily)